jgi:hypothetical protein
VVITFTGNIFAKITTILHYQAFELKKFSSVDFWNKYLPEPVNQDKVYLQNEIHPVIGIFCPGDDFRLYGRFLFDHFPSEIP